MALDDQPVQLKALTGQTAAGVPHYRRPEVESQIESALRLDRSALMSRARVSDRSSAEYLKDECLTYLIRDAYRKADQERYAGLTSILLARWTTWIRESFRSLGVPSQDLDVNRPGFSGGSVS